MGRRQLLALIFVSGYVVAFVPVLWARRDISRIPRSIWRYTAPHPREVWRGALLVAYVCGGWPGLLVAILWRVSNDRDALREEWAHLHRRNVQPRRAKAREDAARTAAPPAPSAEPEIVLADYEEAAEVDEPTRPSHEDAPPASG
jgi:hypothetical protein